MALPIETSVNHVRVAKSEKTTTLSLNDSLDANVGVELLAALHLAIEDGAPRIDIDLLAVETWTPEGARALRRCRRLARTIQGGLHYRTGQGAGHDALLEAFAESPDDPETGEHPLVTVSDSGTNATSPSTADPSADKPASS